MESTILWTALFYFFALHLIYNLFRPGLRAIPGPFLAKFSSLYRVYLVNKGRYSYDILGLHRKYGPYVRLGPDVVSISDPAMVESIYGVRNDFPKSDWVKSSQTLYQGKTVPALLTTQDKQVHSALKRTIASAYTVTTLMGYEAGMEETICLFARKLDELFIQTGEICQMDKWLQFYAYDIIGVITMSRPLGFLEAGEDIDGILEEIQSESVYRALTAQMPVLDYIIRKNRLVRTFGVQTHRVMVRARSILTDRLNRYKDRKEEEPHDFIFRFMEAKEKHPDILGERNMMGFVGSNLQAGSDTTAIALRTIVYYVYRNKDVLKKLREELDSYTETHPIPFQDAYNKLPYTDAVIREALRIYPPFALLLERRVPETGLELSNGVKLPVNTRVGMFGYTLHRDREIFGEDVDDFNPDRWLQSASETEEAFQERVAAMKRMDLSFSHGTRKCIGHHIAELQIYKLVPTLFRVFDFEVVNPNEDWEINQKFFALQSNMPMRIRWRDGWSMAQLGSVKN